MESVDELVVRGQWASYLINAIKAKELFFKDVNYIIRGKEVLIVDEFSGRVMQVIDSYQVFLSFSPTIQV